MTVHEIFATPAIVRIEYQILRLFNQVQKRKIEDRTARLAIKELLQTRKQLLDDLFVMDEYYKSLLYDFNEALIVQLLRMREKTIKMYNAVRSCEQEEEIIATGKCFLGYEYSSIHPVQTPRARQMWEVLNATYDCYMPTYDDGADQFTINSDEQPTSANQLLWPDDTPEGNWNEGLDPELTADMHLTFAFHNLWETTGFSIFDLLWVRDFNIEITVECDYSS